MGADNIQKGKNQNFKKVKNLGIQEVSIKRSYALRAATIRKLQELKVFVYTDTKIDYLKIKSGVLLEWKY